MRIGCVKKMRGSTSDRISCLPRNVIEKILTCMPTKDAVRTSVLSKKWRYNWVTIPELEFDEKSISTTRESRTRSTTEFLMTIYQVLLLHRGPILKFKLYLSKWENCSAVDKLIPFVSGNGVRDLILHIRSPYRLPSSLFSCVELEHLELHYCLFALPPGFNGFNKLHSLELYHVVINSKDFSSLISNCPLLKELKLVDPASMNFRYLEITAPNLRCLFYEGHFRDTRLKNAPNLARVSIDWHYSMNEENVSKWITLFAGLPAIEFLELKYRHLELIPQSDIPRRLPVVLSHLKILNLDGINLDSVGAVSIILSLIRSSPNLEKINLRRNHFSRMPIVEHFEEQGFLDISLNRLREVVLRMECDRGFQVELVKFLLATSPILEKMFIVPIRAMDKERLMFWKAVTQFKRLSPFAEVFFEFGENELRSLLTFQVQATTAN